MKVLVKQEQTAIEWQGASARGLVAKQERDAIVGSLLKENLDYGKPYHGAPKPTLLKAGAEKICDCLNVFADYEIVSHQENWDMENPIFAYTVKCTLKQRGTGLIVGTGIGSCNSFEEKYYWRNQDRICVKCGASAIIKGKKEYGGGWLCFKKKGGCGHKYPDGDQSIESQNHGKVRNENIFDQVNTILKMAEKRAHVAATLNVGSFSEIFTQDLEDMPKKAVSYDAEYEIVDVDEEAEKKSLEVARNGYLKRCKQAEELGIKYTKLNGQGLYEIMNLGKELRTRIDSATAEKNQESDAMAERLKEKLGAYVSAESAPDDESVFVNDWIEQPYPVLEKKYMELKSKSKIQVQAFFAIEQGKSDDAAVKAVKESPVNFKGLYEISPRLAVTLLARMQKEK